MNKTLINSLKLCGAFVVSFLASSLNAQVITTGDVNFANNTTTNICANGINFFDDGGPTAPYLATVPAVTQHTIRFVDVNAYGNSIVITSNNIDLDAATGEQDTLAIYENTSFINVVTDEIISSGVANGNLVAYAAGGGLFNAAGAPITTIPLAQNANAVFALKQTGATNAGAQGWAFAISLTETRAQGMSGEVRFTNGGPQPNTISNNGNIILCPEVAYNFVFNITDFNPNMYYTRAIDIDSIIVDYGDGSAPFTITGGAITTTGDPTNPVGMEYAAKGGNTKSFATPVSPDGGAYNLTYTVYDRNCDIYTFNQNIGVLSQPGFAYSSSFGLDPYTICQGDAFTVSVNASPTNITGAFTEGTTTENYRFQPTVGNPNYTLNANGRTLTLDPATAPGVYQLVVDYTYNQNNACTFNDTITVTVQTPVYAGNESVTVVGEDQDIPFVCETETSFNLFTLLTDTSSTLNIDMTGVWTDASGAVVSNIIDPSTLGGAGGYSFTYTVSGTGVCPDDMETVRLDVESDPFAGTSMTVAQRRDECSSINNIDLFGTNYIGSAGAPDLGGTWVCTNVPGSEAFITLNRFLDLSKLNLGTGNSRDFIFRYTVTGRATTNAKDAPCADDQAFARIRVFRSPLAGQDSTLFICNSEAAINLNTLLRNENYQGTGNWSGDAAVAATPGLFTPSVTFDPRQITAEGTYVMSYKLDQPNTGVPPCTADQINITFHAILQPDAGDDGTADACDTDNAFDLLTALSRQPNSTNGKWYALPGNTLVGGTGTNLVDLTALGGQTVMFKYLVPGNLNKTPGRGCSADSATVTITVQQALRVGVSRENIAACITDAAFAPFDTLGTPKDPNGVWSPAIQGSAAFDATFNPAAANLNQFYEYTYTHPSNTPGCVALESIVSVTVYDLPNAGADNAQIVDICNVDNTFDLTTLIEAGVENGVNGTTMLTWVFKSADGLATVDPTTGIVDISNLGDRDGEDYVFNYIVQSQGCVNDTASLLIKVFKKGNAGNDNSFTACSSDASEFLLFNLVNLAGTTDNFGTWTDVTPSGGLNGTDNLATFVPMDVTAVTDFPTTGADTLYYIVVVPNCPNDTAAIASYTSKAPLAGISNTPIGVDGPLAVCESETDLDLYTGLTDTYDEEGRWTLDIWPPARNADPAFLALRDNVNNNVPAANGDLYFKPDGNIFNVARFDSNYVNTHNGDPKELFKSPIFRFRYIVRDTTNFPMAANNYGYRCPGDTAFVYVRMEADFTNTDNFNFELVANPATAGALNPPLDITKVVVCETETEFKLNDYFPGLTDIISCVNAPQDEFTIETLPAGATYNVGTDYFVNATVIDSSETLFETITLNVTNECGTATTQAPLELRIEPFVETIAIDPIRLCENGATIDLSLEDYIGKYYGDNFTTFNTTFDPRGSADDILVTDKDVDPSKATFPLGTFSTYIIDLEIERMHCPDVSVPINITIDQKPYAGEDQVGVEVCEGGIINLNTFVDPAGTDPVTGQTTNTNGIFTCLNCVPSYTPQPYSSATFNTAGQGGNILEFRYTVTNPGCGPVTSRLQLVIGKKPYPGVSQTVTVCNNQSNIFLPALLTGTAGLPDGGGRFTPDPFKGKNGNFLDATQLAPGTYTFTYTVGGKPGDICPAESAILTINIEDAPTAGTDGDVDVCIGDGPVNLFTAINGQVDSIGKFEPINPGTVSATYLSGINSESFNFTRFFNESPAPKPSIALFRYVVQTGSCPADTSIITVNLSPAPKSGVMDTIPLVLCNDLVTFDLFTVLGNVEVGNGAGDYLAGGTWSPVTPENGDLAGSIIDPSKLSSTRTHLFKYTVSTDCGTSSSVVRLLIDKIPDVGIDVSDSICALGQVINLTNRYPQFTGGTWVDVNGSGGLVGNLFDYTLATPAPSYLLQYQVASKLGECSAGTADVTLKVFKSPNAGNQEIFTFVACQSLGNVDLFDILQGEDAGGKFVAPAGIENVSGLVGSVLRVDQIPDGDYNIRYIVKSGPCTPDTSIIKVRISGNDPTSPYCGDFDGDGIINSIDLDIDNDGISNLKESNNINLLGDHDKDLIPNYLDGDYASFIGSTFEKGVVTAFDFDRDGIVNMFDLDSDGDSIYDLVEAFPASASAYDANKDGQTDVVNGDGINDLASNDQVVNTDGVDGPDFLDTDSDNDGIFDVAENKGQKFDVINTDGDAFANYRDLDSDNDGISDAFENTGGTSSNPVDTDGDGKPDYVDFDSDGDGILDAEEAFLTLGIPEDFDGDGLYNFQDLDSDNDLIADAIEAVNFTSPVDTDTDGFADFRDKDSDNDGIADKLEGLCKVVGDIPNDADSDGIPDYRELDSDDDLLLDALEAGADLTAPLDTDGDGFYDFQEIDADNDGLLDNYEARGTINAAGYIDTPIDSDMDGLFDFQDEDSDADRIPDYIEGFDDRIPGFAGVDTDNDGTPDYLDLDSDDDTISDDDELGFDPDSPDDSDGDGIYDFRELDSDNDGVLDRIEGDGDCDNDGTPNYKDAGDNCKITTFIPEGFSPNGDNVNETFVIPDLDTFPGKSLKVYNRWGGLIFEMETYNNQWDGKDMNGTRVVDGTYFYTLDLGLGQEPQTGFVYIVGNE